MSMWMSWLNLQTDKTERIYNYHDPDTPEGQMAIDMATHCLWQRFQVPPDQIPRFRVENPPGFLPPEGQSQLRKLPSRTPSAPGRSPSLTGRSEECT